MLFMKHIYRSNIVPRRVEIHFSWPILNAVLGAFNSEDCRAYLQRVWQIITCPEKSYEGFTYPHLCSAHIIHQMSRNLKKINVPKFMRETITFFFALLVNKTSLREAGLLFKHISIVLGSPKEIVPSSSKG